MSRPRRPPRFARFLWTGAVLGFVAGAAVSYRGESARSYGEGAAMGYLGVFGAMLGLLVAAVVAVLLDRRR